MCTCLFSVFKKLKDILTSGISCYWNHGPVWESDENSGSSCWKKKKVYYKPQVQLGSNYILHFHSEGNCALLKTYVSIHSKINSCFPKHQWYYRFY